MTRSIGQNGVPNNLSPGEDNSNGVQGKRKVNGASAIHLNKLTNGQVADNDEGLDPVVEELNSVRLREITSKTVSGILLMLLKWFKFSRESANPKSVPYSAKADLLNRHPQIRIPNSAASRRGLPTTNPQSLRPSRHRPSSRPEK